MRLIRVIRQEAPDRLRAMLAMAAISALGATAITGLVDKAAIEAGKGTPSLRLVLLFAIAVTMQAVGANYLLSHASDDAETIIHRLRLRLFDLVRQSDLVTIERVGAAKLHGALTRDPETLSRCLPYLVIGVQQVIMLVFLGLYLAWLSPIACVMVFGFAAGAVAIRYFNVVALGLAMRSAIGAENRVFNGLTGMLQGIKEMRMSRPRADGLVEETSAASAEARDIKTHTHGSWGWEFAVKQSMFYALTGMMVFLVPLIAKDYTQVVVPATMATLFIVGPVGMLSRVTPMVTETELALANIESVEETLRRQVPEAGDEAAEPLVPPAVITLDAATFTYTDANERRVFSVGPLSLSLRAGEIAFITGGNGSGKSTLLRMLTGLVPLAGGRLLADGVPVTPIRMQAYRDHITAIFADNHLSRHLYGLPDIDQARTGELLTEFELDGKVHVADGAFSTIELSTGQRKRLALLIAELEDKPILVFDEWAADQDPHFRRIFYERILPEFREKNRIVICVTHDDRWFGVADRLYHMSDGRMTETLRSTEA